MQQDKPTINLTVPIGWDKLDDKQLRYVFGLTHIKGTVMQKTKSNGFSFISGPKSTRKTR